MVNICDKMRHRNDIPGKAGVAFRDAYTTDSSSPSKWLYTAL